MDQIQSFFNQHNALQTITWFVALSLFCVILAYALRFPLFKWSHYLFSRFGDINRESLRQTIRYISLMAGLFLFYALLPVIPHLPIKIYDLLQKLIQFAACIPLALALISCLDIIHLLYMQNPERAKHPIKGYIQLGKIIVFILSGILILSVITGRSPLILLSGLSAMAAVIILLFQDTLLSLVAGIQISAADSIRVGDRIEMESPHIDGTVKELSLHSVKIDNFDKTTTILPVRKLVNTSFKNWRSVKEAGMRRIKRPLFIDPTSVKVLSTEDIEKLHKSADFNPSFYHGGLNKEKERLDNIAAFRAYALDYLQKHPKVQTKANVAPIVSLLEATPQGLPVEIYCFVSAIDSNGYEILQSEIFQHLYAALSRFDLRIFQIFTLKN